jgi:sodium transport system ATP-binding protein
VIEARGLTKHFGRIAAALDVSFVARDGEITGLVGPNGAGKSTTLRMLYGVLAPERGQAFIDEFAVQNEPERARARLGVLPHAAGLYGNLTARENIAYFGRLQGLDAGRLPQLTETVIDALDMRDFANQRAKGFSQGQKVKTALARALVHGPRNLILDEPTNGLDVMAIRSLRELLLRLRDQGHCIVFSSHVMQEVAALCDRIVIIGSGRVLAHGTADEIRGAAADESLEDTFLRVLGRPADAG